MKEKRKQSESEKNGSEKRNPTVCVVQSGILAKILLFVFHTQKRRRRKEGGAENRGKEPNEKGFR